MSFHVQYNPLEDSSNVWLNAYFWQVPRSRINLTAILTCSSETWPALVRVIIHTLYNYYTYTSECVIRLADLGLTTVVIILIHIIVLNLCWYEESLDA